MRALACCYLALFSPIVNADLTSTLVKSHTLISGDQTIKFGDNGESCLEVERSKRVRAKACIQSATSVVPEKQKWTHDETTSQIKSVYNNKCWRTTSIRLKKGRTKGSIKLARCSDPPIEQEIFTVSDDDGIIRVTVDGKNYCLSAVALDAVRLDLCSKTMVFGDYQETCEIEGVVAEGGDDKIENFSDGVQTGDTETFTTEPKLVGDRMCHPTVDVTCGLELNSSCTSTVVENCELTCVNKNHGGTPLKVASFNIQILGDAKSRREVVMRTLPKIFEMFDIVAVQELKDADASGEKKFFSEYLDVGSQAGMWTRVYSERDGSRNANSNEYSSEQLVFYYRHAKLDLVKMVSYDDVNDLWFVRGPATAHFRRLEEGAILKEFSLMQMHLSPNSDAVAQADHLDEIQDILVNGGSEVDDRNLFGDDDITLINVDENDTYPEDMIITGDLNASQDYWGEGLNTLAMKHDPAYQWLISDDDDTGVSSSQKPYDRIILYGDGMHQAGCHATHIPAAFSAEEVANNEVGVFNFDTFFEEARDEWIAEFTAANGVAPSSSELSTEGGDDKDRVSDHYPVFFTMY